MTYWYEEEQSLLFPSHPINSTQLPSLFFEDFNQRHNSQYSILFLAVLLEILEELELESRYSLKALCLFKVYPLPIRKLRASFGAINHHRELSLWSDGQTPPLYNHSPSVRMIEFLTVARGQVRISLSSQACRHSNHCRVKLNRALSVRNVWP